MLGTLESLLPLPHPPAQPLQARPHKTNSGCCCSSMWFPWFFWGPNGHEQSVQWARPVRPLWHRQGSFAAQLIGKWPSFWRGHQSFRFRALTCMSRVFAWLRAEYYVPIESNKLKNITYIRKVQCSAGRTVSRKLRW